jgi:hypothetical protein
MTSFRLHRLRQVPASEGIQSLIGLEHVLLSRPRLINRGIDLVLRLVLDLG